MADLEKLTSQLQSMDMAQFADALTENQNTLFKGILVVGSVALGVMMFNDHHAKEIALKTKMTQMQQKLDTIKSRDAAIKDLDDFKASIPKKINEFELITLISDYTKIYNITISSLTPAESKDMGLFDLINVSFDLKADNYKDMMLFLREIEKSNFSLRINSWSGHEEDDGKMIFVIEISAVLVHT